MRSIAILSFFMLMLAGCSEEAGDPDSATEAPDTTPDTGDNETTTPTPEGNTTAPTEPTVTGNSTEATNEAPNATLQLDGAAVAGAQTTFFVNVTDADGDEVSWTFDADGDGAADLNGTGNATAVYTYGAEGTYTATLNVTDGMAANTTTLEVVVEAPGPTTDPNAPEDRGWYVYYPATGICDVKDYTDVGGLGTLYNAELAPGGDWYIMEDNGIPGLQYADGHPADAAGSLPLLGTPFNLDQPDCTNGDVIIL